MNLTQAEAIASLYTELLESIDRTKIPLPPVNSWTRREWKTEHISEISLEDGQVKVEWSQYTGCNEYDSETVYYRLEDLFD